MELQRAIRAVVQASRVTEQVRLSLANVSVSKDDKYTNAALNSYYPKRHRSPVTVADFAAQACRIAAWCACDVLPGHYQHGAVRVLPVSHCRRGGGNQ